MSTSGDRDARIQRLIDSLLGWNDGGAGSAVSRHSVLPELPIDRTRQQETPHNVLRRVMLVTNIPERATRFSDQDRTHCRLLLRQVEGARVLLGALERMVVDLSGGTSPEETSRYRQAVGALRSSARLLEEHLRRRLHLSVEESGALRRRESNA